MEEKELIGLLRAGDPRGAEELLRHYTPLLRYIISPILRDERDREDCLSEISMRVWEKIGGYDESRGSWTGWLTALARNTALNRLRQNRRHETEEPPHENTASPSPTPEELILREERQKALKQALSGLPDRDRLLFYRKYYYMQSTAQIAAELGTTQRAVEGRLYRIRGKLRVMLGGEGNV